MSRNPPALSFTVPANIRGAEPEQPEPDGLFEAQLDALGDVLYGYCADDRVHDRRLDEQARARAFIADGR